MVFKLQIAVITALALCASFVWYVVFSAHTDFDELSVLDVGQGDAIFIQSKNGNQVLVDGGSGRAVLSALSRHMPAYDKSIDVLVATHMDVDHLGGLVEVLKHYDVGAVIENDFIAQTGIYKEWEKLITQKHIPRRVVAVGDSLMLGDQARLDFLGPYPQDYIPLPTKANEIMIVSRFVSGSRSALLMGDIERADEIRLAQSKLDIQSDILKVAHHGSKNSTTDLFLEGVTPSFAVISVGAQNRYGHPNEETLGRLERSHARIFRTDEEGDITFRTDGARLEMIR